MTKLVELWVKFWVNQVKSSFKKSSSTSFWKTWIFLSVEEEDDDDMSERKIAYSHFAMCRQTFLVDTDSSCLLYLQGNWEQQ